MNTLDYIQSYVKSLSNNDFHLKRMSHFQGIHVFDELMEKSYFHE